MLQSSKLLMPPIIVRSFHVTSSFNTETTKRLGLPKATDMILLTIVKTEPTEKYSSQ